MTRLLAVFFLLLTVLSPVHAGSVHIVLSADSDSHLQAASDIKAELEQQDAPPPVTVRLLKPFQSFQPAADDLLVTVGEAATRYVSQSYSEHSQLYSYINHMALPEPQAKHWASVMLDQPLQTLLDSAVDIVEGRYHNKLVIAVSEENQSMRLQIDQLTIPDSVELEVLVIEAEAEPAKIIDQALFNAGALIALRDSRIWSGETAKWMLYQSYKYNVPVVGYSQSFLKAGALVSVYASLRDIAHTTAQQIIGWQNNQGRLTQEGILYPRLSIDYNKNIARALNIPLPESMTAGEQNNVRD
ncbi:hypothetical protein [uncultured Methylophaga sp.]|uniref:hypothetical protein n=1 Tax=uncultured Methylophaga sp. TaxID=285271 RepID=UPI002616E44A|nr:hypothetical protein [uncultured Methylophaga sp.]